MHYKNQIDTILTTLELYFDIAHNDGNDETLDVITDAIYTLERIVNNDYETSQGMYNDPVAEAMSQLMKANLAMAK